jgi:hypothetical protein
VTAHQGRLDRDPIPNSNRVHAVGDGYHHTDHFMSGVVGGLHESVLTMDTGLVRTAHPRHRHLNQRFAGLK